MAVGLVVVGLGNVGSSLLAGIEAARAHLVHPWGTLTEAGGVARTTERGTPEPLRSRVPLAELSELVLGAFELRDDDAYRAALRAAWSGRTDCEVVVVEGAEHGFVHDPERDVHRADDAARAWERALQWVGAT